MSEFHDDRSSASHRVRIGLSDEKLKRLDPVLYGAESLSFRKRWGQRELDAQETRRMIAEHMHTGDSRAAVVVSLEPLIVAPYTDEMDCVVLLSFPLYLAREMNLKLGARLLTVNTYGRGKRLMPDLSNGPLSYQRYHNFYPIIAEFVSDDLETIEARKRAIDESEWERALRMGESRLHSGQPPRDGKPTASSKPVVKRI